MPLYDFKCRPCGKVLQDVWLSVRERADVMMMRCSYCARRTKHDQMVSAANVDDWGCNQEGKFFEHLAPQGMYFRDRKSFKDYLRRKGLREQHSFVD